MTSDVNVREVTSDVNVKKVTSDVNVRKVTSHVNGRHVTDQVAVTRNSFDVEHSSQSVQQIQGMRAPHTPTPGMRAPHIRTHFPGTVRQTQAYARSTHALSAIRAPHTHPHLADVVSVSVRQIPCTRTAHTLQVCVHHTRTVHVCVHHTRTHLADVVEVPVRHLLLRR